MCLSFFGPPKLGCSGKQIHLSLLLCSRELTDISCLSKANLAHIASVMKQLLPRADPLKDGTTWHSAPQGVGELKPGSKWILKAPGDHQVESNVGPR